MKEIKEEYKILKLIQLTGRTMLENGSEISRVESAAVDIGNYYNYSAQCFATLTCMVISITNNDGEIYSVVERIKGRGTNLDKVSKIDELVTCIDKYSYNDFISEVHKIKNEQAYNIYLQTLGYSLGAGFFVFLFNGNFKEFIVSMVGGFILSLVALITGKLRLNQFFSNVLFGLICSLIPSLFLKANYIDNVSTSIISILMITVPGVSFINAIRDLFSGDLVSSLSRMLEVVLIAMSLAIGSGIILKMLII